MRRDLPCWVLSAAGLGFLRPAPGTWGSLPPVVLAIAILRWWGPGWHLEAALLALGAAASVACVTLGRRVEASCGAKDPSIVVADEVAGQCVALLLLPWRPWAEGAGFNLTLSAGAFLAFRAMDILKPPPARGLQRIRGGAGILIDDVIAGLYAALLVQAAARTLDWWRV